MSNNKKTLLDRFYKNVFLFGLIIGILLLAMIGYGSHKLAEKSYILESKLDMAITANEKTVNLKLDDSEVCLRVISTAHKKGWKEVTLGAKKLDLQDPMMAFSKVYSFCEQAVRDNSVSFAPYFTFFR